MQAQLKDENYDSKLDIRMESTLREKEEVVVYILVGALRMNVEP